MTKQTPVGYGLKSVDLASLTKNMTAGQAHQLRRVKEAHERDHMALQNSKDAGFGRNSDGNSIYSSKWTFDCLTDNIDLGCSQGPNSGVQHYPETFRKTISKLKSQCTGSREKPFTTKVRCTWR